MKYLKQTASTKTKDSDYFCWVIQDNDELVKLHQIEEWQEGQDLMAMAVPAAPEHTVKLIASFLVWLGPDISWMIEFERKLWDFGYTIRGVVDVNGKRVQFSSKSPSLDYSRPGDGTDIKFMMTSLYRTLQSGLSFTVLGKTMQAVYKELPTP